MRIHRIVSPITLAGFVLVAASPCFSAGITLTSRTSQVSADAIVPGQEDTPEAKTQFDFLPASLTISAAAGGGDTTASSITTIHSAIELDATAGTLRVTGDGTASAMVTTPVDDGQTHADVGGTIIVLQFNLAEVASYTITGQISGAPQGSGIGVAILSGPSGEVFRVISEGSPMQISRSGTLPAGLYTLNVSLGVTVNPTPSNPSHSGNASGNFDFNVNGTSTPTPTPIPTPTPTPIQWTNSAGGDFHTGTNWDLQMVPGVNATAFFGLQSTYEVNLGTANTERLEIHSGNVTFVTGDYTVAATGFDPAGIVVDNATLSLSTLGSLGGVHALIGESAAARVDVTGVTTFGFLSLSGSLRIGGAGNGILNVNSGASVSSGEGRIGTGVGGGEATLSGHNAHWTSGNLSVGYSGGDGDLTISNGAKVDSNSGFVGFGTGLAGSVIVQGVDPTDADVPSKWVMTNDLIVGQNSTGNLTVQNGGQVTCNNASFGVAGSGSAHLSAPNQKINNLVVTSQLTVGQSSTGFLEINGGTGAHAGSVIAGSAAFGHGIISVSGKSASNVASTLLVDGSLTLGLNGIGTLLIREDAVVTTGAAALGAINGAIGLATLGIDGAAGAPAQWTVNSDLTLGALAPGKIVLHNSANVTVNGTLFILANGSIGGNGTFSAQMVENDGNNTPGNSPGTLTIDSDYEQTVTGKLVIEAAGLGAGQFDLLHVTGDATLSGTLQMSFLGDYLPKSGDSFQFLQVDGTIIGDFTEVTFPQLAPGFQFDTTQVAGGIVFTAINDAVLAPTFLLNISTRLQVAAGDNVLIGGFIVQGTEPKQVLIRAIGPSLEAAGVSGALADPTLELHDSTGAIIGQNDNWRLTQTGGLITGDQVPDIFATGISPTSDAESAIIATLDPGAYTAIVAGTNSGTGIGLVEVYDLGPAGADAKLANISTRGFVQTDDNVMIGGFIIGNQTSRVLLRGIGPSLSAVGISNALADPTLELHDGNGNLLTSNDNWKDTQQIEIEATGIPPTDDAESAILQSLVPGAYTAILRGVNDSTGVGLVEIYNLPNTL